MHGVIRHGGRRFGMGSDGVRDPPWPHTKDSTTRSGGSRFHKEPQQPTHRNSSHKLRKPEPFEAQSQTAKRKQTGLRNHVRQYSQDTLQRREHETRKQLHERLVQSLRALSVVHTTYSHCTIYCHHPHPGHSPFFSYTIIHLRILTHFPALKPRTFNSNRFLTPFLSPIRSQHVCVTSPDPSIRASHFPDRPRDPIL